jgi:site-specific DNA recombinase
MVLPVRIELTTSPLPRGCSTTELRQPGAPRLGLRRRANTIRRAPWQDEPRTALDSADAVRLHRLMRQGPSLTTGKRADRAARDARLAAALRDNLRRRKEQARAQAASPKVVDRAQAVLSGNALSSKSRYHGDDIAD